MKHVVHSTARRQREIRADIRLLAALQLDQEAERGANQEQRVGLEVQLRVVDDYMGVKNNAILLIFQKPPSLHFLGGFGSCKTPGGPLGTLLSAAFFAA